jgi:hypothetical protein
MGQNDGGQIYSDPRFPVRISKYQPAKLVVSPRTRWLRNIAEISFAVPSTDEHAKWSDFHVKGGDITPFNGS